MNRLKLLILLFTFTGFIFFLANTFNTLTTIDDCTFMQFNDDENKEEESSKPTDWLFAQRAFPHGQVNREAYMEALHQAQKSQKQTRVLTERGGTDWSLAGPTNVGGRITTIAVHSSEPQTVYIGAAAGGVFKTTNGGNSWIPVFDNNSSLAIGDIAVCPSNKNTLYVGTGEANGGGGSVSFDGVGVFKSTNGGTSWQHIGLNESGSIGKIAIDPQNENRVFVAAMGYLYEPNSTRGVYRTSDGGTTWKRVLASTDTTGCIDLAINPNNPNIVYAALWERIRYPNYRNYGGTTCGIYRSKDGGDTWQKLTSGLPSDNIGRIGIALSPANPSVIYSTYTDVIGNFKGVYKTSDGGDNWQQMDPNHQLEYMYSSFGWWFGKIFADPLDANTAYALGLGLNKTSDGGQSWQEVGGNIHVDQHALWINPNNTNHLYVGNDGGFYATENGSGGWVFKDNLPITQFYTCEIDNKNPQRLYGGTQDNGTWRTLTGNTYDWAQLFGGDGFISLVDPVDNNFVFVSTQNGNLIRSTDGGQNFAYGLAGISNSDRKNWKTPYIMAPNTSSTMYYGSNKIYRSTNRGAIWTPISPDLTNGDGGVGFSYGTITSISVSPLNENIIYCGTDDGNAWVTSNGGVNWVKINNGLPNRWVTNITADPFDENTAYITFSGYKWWDYEPHILKTTNKGATWQDISNNLPEAPINDFIADTAPNSKTETGARVYYVATDFGVYVTYNAGANWTQLGTSLPLVSVMDIALHDDTRSLVAATHGRSMYRITVPNIEPTYTITGSIRREKGDTVIAQISLFKNTLFQTLNESLFSFKYLEQGNEYKIEPYRNDNPLRGITTLDIALITRHILDLNNFDSPYKIIAADVNKDNEIDATDILWLRKLILRQIDSLPNTASWRFVPQNHVFTNMQNPFLTPIKESLIFTNLAQNISNADFYAIKLGDVNYSATLPFNKKIETRNADKQFNINILDKILEKDKTYKIPLNINTPSVLEAFQMALKWDNSIVDVLGIEKAELPNFDESNFAIFKSKNRLAVSWNSIKSVLLQDTTTLFNLIIKTKKTASLSEIIALDSDFTEGVAYIENDESATIKLNFNNPKNCILTVSPSYPNPFSFQSTIPFELSKNGMVHIKICDISGKILVDDYRQYDKGRNVYIFQQPNTPSVSSILVANFEINNENKSIILFHCN